MDFPLSLWEDELITHPFLVPVWISFLELYLKMAAFLCGKKNKSHCKLGKFWVINACLNWKILRSPLRLGLLLYHQGHESYLIRMVVFKLVIVECYFPDKLLLWTFIIQKSWSGCSGYTGSGGSRVLLDWLLPWSPLERPPPLEPRAPQTVWKGLWNTEYILPLITQEDTEAGGWTEMPRLWRWCSWDTQQPATIWTAHAHYPSAGNKHLNHFDQECKAMDWNNSLRASITLQGFLLFL